MNDSNCIFCRIVAKHIASNVVFEDDEAIAFLDNDPLFPGHVLLSPREHYETLPDLPEELAGPMMLKTQMLARAVKAAMGAEGTFIAMNNTVSQTVPHLHIHVVPRQKKDGLKGFFWPRQGYKDAAHGEAVRDSIRDEIQKLLTARTD